MTRGPSVPDVYADVVRDDDWKRVLTDMRPADRAEVAALGTDPETALRGSLALSEAAFTIREGDDAIGMFGVAANGAVWMLGTGGIERVKFRFLRKCSPWVNALHAVSPMLWNWADSRNALHLRWLRWLGFRLGVERPIGVNGEMFTHFIRTKDHV